jgi:copper(I)-binding protein
MPVAHRLLPLVLLLGACGGAPQPELVATDVTVTRPMPGMTMSAAYLTLHNNTNRTISVTRVTSKEFASVELHETTVEDGVARMRSLPRLEIPAKGNVTLERAGKHLMLMRPTGSVESVSLQFYDGETLLLTVNTAYAAPRPDPD